MAFAAQCRRPGFRHEARHAARLADIMGRLVADRSAQRLGQPVVGFEPMAHGAESRRQRIVSETERWGRVAQQAGLAG
jgi:hypothetical protein